MNMRWVKGGWQTAANFATGCESTMCSLAVAAHAWGSWHTFPLPTKYCLMLQCVSHWNGGHNSCLACLQCTILNLKRIMPYQSAGFTAQYLSVITHVLRILPLHYLITFLPVCEGRGRQSIWLLLSARWALAHQGVACLQDSPTGSRPR